MLQVLVLNGSREGQRGRFQKPVVTFGRHPQCDFRFPAEQELDVSGRHAQIRLEQNQYRVLDSGSTNGTWVNGEKIHEPRILRSGDVISLGADGPRLEILLDADARSEIRAGSLDPSRALIAACVLLALTAGTSLWMLRAERRRHAAELAVYAQQSDSLTALYTQSLRSMSGRMLSLDSALLTARKDNESLRQSALRSSVGRGSGVDLIATDSRERQRALGTVAPSPPPAHVDFAAIAASSSPAVVLIAVEHADGSRVTGTGFCVTREGLIVTNRHVLLGTSSRPARRVMVIFSDTRSWLPARIVNTSNRTDLGVAQIEVSGPFPVIAGIARSGAQTRVGTPVALIGFPLGTALPMEGSGSVRIKAASTFGGGIVSKVLQNVMQVDAYAGQGSSGSPVLDGAGNVVGVVYGGAKESGGRIVYAVPSDLLIPLLPQSASGLLRE
ncbi:MAG: trypsin-like peptidase domain-containing protein [Gemmatimonadaceae bacterium]